VIRRFCCHITFWGHRVISRVDTTSGKLVATIEPRLSRGLRDRLMAEVRYVLEDRSTAPWRADGWDATRGFQPSLTPNLVQVLRNN
jgi:hypothetical protein